MGSAKGAVMIHIQKILLAVDFSEQSKQAVDLGCDLAKRYDAAITLMHVFQIPGYVFPDGFVVITPAMFPELMNKLDATLAELKKDVEAKGLKQVSTYLVEGAPFAEIVRFARDSKFDLIVMGTHGRTGIKHALIGSVAEKVVRKAPCPVLTVRSLGHAFEAP
jgi:nucleotide-binding universal stress UspA family protein